MLCAPLWLTTSPPDSRPSLDDCPPATLHGQERENAMLTVNGNIKRLCNGLTRRDLIKVGGMGLASARFAPGALALNSSTSAAPGFGKAKNCICLFLYGSHSQIETFDPKPDAAEGIRGELGSIPSAVPGVWVNELLPRTARITDRLPIIRAVTHPHPVHGVA